MHQPARDSASTSEKKFPPGRAPPERASDSVLRSRLCLAVGRGLYPPLVTTYSYLGEFPSPLNILQCKTDCFAKQGPYLHLIAPTLSREKHRLFAYLPVGIIFYVI